MNFSRGRTVIVSPREEVVVLANLLLTLTLCDFAVRRHHQHGRWQARIGRVAGNKDLYLGTYSECSSHVLECLSLLNTYMIRCLQESGLSLSLSLFPISPISLPMHALSFV